MDVGTHYEQLFESTPRAYSFSARTSLELEAWQKDFREHLRGLLGLTRMEAELAEYQPQAEKLESIELDGYLRERWVLWTEPTLPLPFYLLKPTGADRTPLVLTPHGHHHPHIYVGMYDSEDEHRRILEGDRDIAVQAVREGYTVIAPATRGFGDTRTAKARRNKDVYSCRIMALHGMLVGRVPIGERVWDMSRLIDWAIANLAIDPHRIAITGNSGGGTVSLFAAACDTRISVSVPSCYFCSFTGSIGTIFHCDCNYVPGILRAGEMWDVAGLITPRPFLAIAGETDPIFPIEQTRMAFDKLKTIYGVAQAADRCQLYVGEGGHRYYKAGAWPFMRQWL